MAADGNTTPAMQDLGGGWSRDAAGRLHKAPEIVEAFAEHCEGIASERNPQGGGPFTRITRHASWYENGSFIANIDGWLEDGTEYPLHGRIYRLKLVERPTWRPRLALRPEPGEVRRDFLGAK